MQLFTEKNNCVHCGRRIIYNLYEIISVYLTDGCVCEAYSRIRINTAVQKHSFPNDIVICKNRDDLLSSDRVISAELYSSLPDDTYGLYRIAFSEKITVLLEGFMNRVFHKTHLRIYGKSLDKRNALCTESATLFTDIKAYDTAF